MKGMVFTELLEMAEQALGEDVVDEILDNLPLSSDGAYSAVGFYPCSELFMIVGAVSDKSGLPVSVLQKQFGQWMLGRFVSSYPEFFADKTTAFDMLEAIEPEVHVEVRKLYSDAELPTFATNRMGERALSLHYDSARPLVDFCHGLVEACVAHFGHKATIAVERNVDRPDHAATFTVELVT